MLASALQLAPPNNSRLALSPPARRRIAVLVLEALHNHKLVLVLLDPGCSAQKPNTTPSATEHRELPCGSSSYLQAPLR